MKIEIDELILNTEHGNGDNVANDAVRLQIGEYTDNYVTVGIDELIKSLEAIKACRR